MKLLGKKVSKAKASEPCDACVADCKSCEAPTIYKVSAVLAESCYNKELGVWLFIHPLEGKIIVSQYGNIEFQMTHSIYRVTDAIHNGTFDSVTIKLVKNEQVNN